MTTVVLDGHGAGISESNEVLRYIGLADAKQFTQLADLRALSLIQSGACAQACCSGGSQQIVANESMTYAI